MTAQETTKKLSNVGWFDRLMMGAAFAGLCFCAWVGLVNYVQAAQPINYALAGAGVGFLIYTLLAPLMRKG